MAAVASSCAQDVGTYCQTPYGDLIYSWQQPAQPHLSNFPSLFPAELASFFPSVIYLAVTWQHLHLSPAAVTVLGSVGVGRAGELQLPELLLSSLGYLATNSPSSSWSPSSSVPCCPRLVAVNESRHPEQSQLSLLRECTPEQSNSDQGPRPALLPAAENFFLVSWLTAW